MNSLLKIANKIAMEFNTKEERDDYVKNHKVRPDTKLIIKDKKQVKKNNSKSLDEILFDLKKRADKYPVPESDKKTELFNNPQEAKDFIQKNFINKNAKSGKVFLPNVQNTKSLETLASGLKTMEKYLGFDGYDAIYPSGREDSYGGVSGNNLHLDEQFLNNPQESIKENEKFTTVDLHPENPVLALVYHEVAHTMVNRNSSLNKAIKDKTPEDREMFNYIKKMFELAKKEKIPLSKYGKENMQEFVAEAFTIMAMKKYKIPEQIKVMLWTILPNQNRNQELLKQYGYQ